MNRGRISSTLTIALVASLMLVALGVPALAITSSIYVESSPANASVYVAGTYKGETPLDVPGVYPPGSYSVTVQKDGYISWHTAVIVEEGKQSQVSATLTPLLSTLVVTSKPEGATIILDGTESGTTPKTFENIRAGAHSLRLVLTGYEDWVTTVNLAAGEPLTVDATLETRVTPYTGIVTIQSSPSGADVAIDGTARGQTPLTVSDLPPGIRTIRLTLDGYETWESEVRIDEGHPAQITATLSPLPAPTPSGPHAAWCAAGLGILGAALLIRRSQNQ